MFCFLMTLCFKLNRFFVKVNDSGLWCKQEDNPWLHLSRNPMFGLRLWGSVSERVSLEEKEMRVLASALALALTLTLFLYPEPACRQACRQKLQQEE